MSSPLHAIAGRSRRLPPLRVGVGGPVGSGKTTLVEMLCKAMRDRWDLVVVTNDIYTKEDQRLLTVAGALEADRIMGVETGGCPHTAIREDASINLEAGQHHRVLGRVDVVGDHRDRKLVAQRLAQFFGERRLAGADGAADAYAQGTVGLCHAENSVMARTAKPSPINRQSGE